MNTMTCPACASPEVEALLRLPEVPIHVGLLWNDAESARSCPRAPMNLMGCPHCGYVWNSAFDSDLMDYDQDYDNALHHSPKFAAWEANLAGELVERYGLHGRRLAEIGPGDGRFLSTLCLEGGNTGIGFEPGHNPDRVSELVAQAGVTIYDEYADADSLRGHEVDFVASRHVLEHLPEPLMLIDAIRGGIVDGGSVYIEVPNFSWALDRGAFEDLMYEHCGYYTPETLSHLLSRAGFSEIRGGSTFDGLFASVDAIVGGAAPHDEPIDRAIVDGIRSRVDALAARIANTSQALDRRRDNGETVVAWGGGARAVGLLNLVDAADAVECVIDVNPRKQGTFVTGTGHAILAPDALREIQPDVVVVINPVYQEEISQMVSDLGVRADVISI